MCWITVKARVASDATEEMERLSLKPNEEDYVWTTKAIRSEDIADFYKKTDVTTVINFYDERPRLIVREALEELFTRIEYLDYDIEIEEEIP